MHIFAPTVWACTAATVDLEAVRRALQDDSFAQAKMAEAHRGTAATDEFQLRDGLLIHGSIAWVFTQTLELYLLSSLINPLSLSPWPLKAATEQLREAGIKYKWGFPFAPIAEIDGMPHKGTRKGEVEPVLTLLKLKVPWEEDEFNMGDLQEPKHTSEETVNRCKIYMYVWSFPELRGAAKTTSSHLLPIPSHVALACYELHTKAGCRPQSHDRILQSLKHQQAHHTKCI
ncbi:Hypothetical predicted protein [Podarcis lilfordi]|uniref:Uncharacterized protein n=1 Tax=Podarcis lilfordi TaxID=74358 RepID=A0AA35K785_9SAUR|nr:Hypothetical predicted protein [Podarcis lilfordi]